MENKVTSNLAGGLGNMLFQIAVSYAYGLRHNKTSIYDTSKASQVHKNISTYLDNILRKIDVSNENFNNFSNYSFEILITSGYNFFLLE